MQPTLNDGDLVCMIRTDPDTIQPGDIIAFEVPHLDIGVCHRVIGTLRTQEGPGFITQGDGNLEPDDWIVYSQDIEGKVLANVSYLLPLFNFLESLSRLIVIELVLILSLSVFLILRIRLELQHRRVRWSRSIRT
jgi:signal peptidase I